MLVCRLKIQTLTKCTTKINQKRTQLNFYYKSMILQFTKSYQSFHLKNSKLLFFSWC